MADVLRAPDPALRCRHDSCQEGSVTDARHHRPVLDPHHSDPDRAPHDHGSHGPVAHGAPPDWQDAYTRAVEAARPEPGRRVVTVTLEAMEVEWEFRPGRATRAWAFNGQIPGPTIEAQVGDVLEIHLTNRLPEPTVIHWHGLRISSRIPMAMSMSAR